LNATFREAEGIFYDNGQPSSPAELEEGAHVPGSWFPFVVLFLEIFPDF
jgi:hypothetical protein